MNDAMPREIDWEQAEQVAQLLAQPQQFAVLLDGLIDAVSMADQPDLGRARVFIGALVLWGLGHGYYPRDPDRLAAVLRRLDARPAPAAERERRS